MIRVFLIKIYHRFHFWHPSSNPKVLYFLSQTPVNGKLCNKRSKAGNEVCLIFYRIIGINPEILAMHMNKLSPSYDACLQEMFALGRFGIKLELDTIAGILKRLGSPEKRFKTIHIAGTNGKGSIASYLASILNHSGIQTGLYTSPHLIRFNERFVVNGTMVSDDEIIDAYLAVKSADIGERQATFFEITTAMAFYLFAAKGVTWAIIETGMGGRLDATNILNPELTIISNLSIEHTDYLGDTLEAIAGEKAGIIKAKTPLITGVSQPSALAVIEKISAKHSAPVYKNNIHFSSSRCPASIVSASRSPSSEVTKTETHFDYNGIYSTLQNMAISLPGPHQIDNASLALAACEVLTQRAESSQKHSEITAITEKNIRTGLLKTSWPGRLEYILHDPTVIIDGAHNLQAAENLGKYLRDKKRTLMGQHPVPSSPSNVTSTRHKKEKSPLQNDTERRFIFILGILDDKPYKEMLKHIIPSADHLIFTKAKINRSLEPDQLQHAAKAIVKDVKMEIVPDVADAVAHALTIAGKADLICIAGSLYVAGEAKEKIQNDYLKNRPTS